MIPEKYQNESDTIKQLFTLGNPHERKVARTHQWDDHLAQGFTESDVRVLIQIVLDTESLFTMSDEIEGWACLYAWRTLGQLKSAEAIAPLMSIMDLVDDNDWLLGEFPTVMGMIGKPAIEPLSDFLMDDSPVLHARAAASDGLKDIAKRHPELRDVVITQFGEYLKYPDHSQETLNGLIVCNLMDLKATELIDLIRPLYEQGAVDITTSGDLEDVEIDLGLRSKRDTPKPHYGDPRTTELANLFEGRGSTHNFDSNFSTPQTFVRDTPKLGRNAPCPCGSGKKHKKCCLNK